MLTIEKAVEVWEHHQRVDGHWNSKEGNFIACSCGFEKCIGHFPRKPEPQWSARMDLLHDKAVLSDSERREFENLHNAWSIERNKVREENSAEEGRIRREARRQHIADMFFLAQ